MNRLRVPFGIQSFREIRENGYYYVDKTELIDLLVHDTKYNFLSRPMGFGKSLLVSTMKELFEGNEKLFRGLAIHDSWDWSTRYPVIHLSFGSGGFAKPAKVESKTHMLLSRYEKQFGVPTKFRSCAVRLSRLIRNLRKQTGQRVVILVDEYDKPVFDALDNPDVACANRDFLQGLYSTIKCRDEDTLFCFMTGANGIFKETSICSYINLWNMTFDARYSSICGFTDAELDRVFAPEIEGFDREKMRKMYSGHSWFGNDSVYSPHCILSLLIRGQFRNWWHEYITPKYLTERLRKGNLLPIDLHNACSSGSVLQTFNVNNVDAMALLFQSGYLTVTGSDSSSGTVCYLDYPNHMIRLALHHSLLDGLLPNQASIHFDRKIALHECLTAGDLNNLKDMLQSILNCVPRFVHNRDKQKSCNAYFASLMYSYFIYAEVNPRVEEAANRGRIDLTAESEENVYIFGFKVLNGGKEGDALAQIKDKGYADKYRHTGKKIYLIGAEFSSENRTLARFDVEPV